MTGSTAGAQVALDRLGDAAPLAADADLHFVVGLGVVAAVAAIGDDAGEVRADLRLDLRMTVLSVWPS